jgi:hypothetical protein
MKQFWLKAKVILKPLGNWTLFTVSCLSAFCFGYYYPTLKKLISDEPAVVKEVVVVVKSDVIVERIVKW